MHTISPWHPCEDRAASSRNKKQVPTYYKTLLNKQIIKHNFFIIYFARNTHIFIANVIQTNIL